MKILKCKRDFSKQEGLEMIEKLKKSKENKFYISYAIEGEQKLHVKYFESLEQRDAFTEEIVIENAVNKNHENYKRKIIYDIGELCKHYIIFNITTDFYVFPEFLRIETKNEEEEKLLKLIYKAKDGVKTAYNYITSYVVLSAESLPNWKKLISIAVGLGEEMNVGTDIFNITNDNIIFKEENPLFAEDTEITIYNKEYNYDLF